MARITLLCLLALGLSACPGESGTITPRDGGQLDQPTGGDVITPDGPPIPANCGNKTKDPGEECDDGNQDNTDSCLNTCKLAYCGDGYLQKGVEECDDANQDNNDACSLSCRSQGFQANNITVKDQRYPAVAVAPDGTILVVWQDGSATGGDGSGTTVRMRRFDSKGQAKEATEVVVPTTTAKDQRDPDIACQGNGEALVVWTDWSGSGDSAAPGIRGRVIDKSGTPSGQDFLVNSTTKGPQAAPAVCANPAGGYVVVYNDTSIGGSSNGTDVRMRRVTLGGQPKASDVQVNSTDQGDQMWPDVAAASGGNVLVVWQTWSQNDKESSGIGIAGRVYDQNGQAVTGEKILNSVGSGQQENPQVAFDSKQFVVVWDDDSKQGADSDAQGIRMRGISTGGSPGAAETVINTTTSGAQRHPAVGAGGGIVAAAWEDGSQPAQGLDVRGRRYKGQSAHDATDKLINTSTQLDQALPAVAVSATGVTVVVWEATGSPGDNDGYGIRMRIIGP